MDEQLDPPLGPADHQTIGELGRLRPVSPREVWTHEAHGFTPWLLANKEYLAEALGIDLELEGSEHRVGTFALDLIGRDLTHEAVLIVENQLEGTDHYHLGQLLTYAAGTGAATIVWISTNFREEHRQALDWLNEHTDEDTRFFGIRLEIVRIGESLPAALFNVVAQPNDWQKQVRAATGPRRIEGKGVHYLTFWTRFLERLREEHPEWSRGSKPDADHSRTMPSPIRGAAFSVSFAAGGKTRNELYIDSGDAEYNTRVFGELLSHRDLIEQVYGESLEFEDLPGKQACRIASYGEGDVADIDRHEQFIDWFFDTGTRLRQALSRVDVSPEFRK